MPTLSAAEIARVALDAGFKGDAAVKAVAVAIGESGGDTAARGDTTIQTGKWGPSIGLWQIRSLNSQRGTGGTRDEEANLDPFVNARHAFEISNGGQNWQPWSVFTSGKWLIHSVVARNGVNNPAADVQGRGADGMGDVPSLTPDLNPFEPLMNPGLWTRLGAFILGGALMLLALYQLTGIGDVIVTAAKMRAGIR